MTLKGIVIIVGCALSLNSYAGTMGPIQVDAPFLPWGFIGSLGYVNYQNVSVCEGHTPFGRFAISRELFGAPYSSFGLELGIQSGNTMALDVSETTLEQLGGVPIQTTMKPMLDLLATVKIQSTSTPFFALIKGGAAYREWQFDGRNSVNDLSKITGEVQAGLGYSLGYLGNLSLLYQWVSGGDPNFILNDLCPSGFVSNLPSQQGVMLSFTIMR